MDEKLFFTYEKIQGTILRDFRKELEKQIKILYTDKPIKNIPEEFEIKLKYNVIYKVIFLNREYMLNEFKNEKFNILNLKWFVDSDEY